jgi:hypothetical protein
MLLLRCACRSQPGEKPTAPQPQKSLYAKGEYIFFRFSVRVFLKKIKKLGYDYRILNNLFGHSQSNKCTTVRNREIKLAWAIKRIDSSCLDQPCLTYTGLSKTDAPFQDKPTVMIAPAAQFGSNGHATPVCTLMGSATESGSTPAMAGPLFLWCGTQMHKAFPLNSRRLPLKRNT